MANDYIPRPNILFHAWQNNFVMCVNGHSADLGLAAGDVVDLNNSAAPWTTDYPAHTASQAARQARDNARDGLEGAIRPSAPGVMQPYA